MSVLIGIQDFHHNTDVQILVDVHKRQLLWIPRDLYSFLINDRVNAAYALGGHPLLHQVFNGLKFPITASVIIPAKVTHAIFENYQILVPIDEELQYYYPLKPHLAIEQGKKIIQFSPPYELLSGERIHQFLGARYRVHVPKNHELSDIERIQRQMIFVTALLQQHFNFSIFLDKEIDVFGDAEALKKLHEVNEQFTCSVYRDYVPLQINNKSVLANLTETSNIFNAVRKRAQAKILY